MTEDGGTAPLPGTTVVAPASAILMTLASSTLFMTIGAKAMLHGAPPRLHQDHFWFDLEGHEEEILLHNGIKMSFRISSEDDNATTTRLRLVVRMLYADNLGSKVATENVKGPFCSS